MSAITPYLGGGIVFAHMSAGQNSVKGEYIVILMKGLLGCI